MGNYIQRMVFQPPPVSSYRQHPDLIWLRTYSNGAVPAYFIDSMLLQFAPPLLNVAVKRNDTSPVKSILNVRNARDAPLTVLYSHSNAEDIGLRFSYLSNMSCTWNVNIFLFEYPGYGISDGVPSEKGVYESIEAAYFYLTTILMIPGNKIVAFGRSLGTAACCYLGSKQELKGMILQSPLLSIYRVPFPLSINLPGDIFCTVKMISDVRCAVYIIHGLEDEIVPPYHAMELFKRCHNRVNPYWVEGGRHNDLEVVADFNFSSNVNNFFRYLEAIS